jgi:hypothetical protein
MIRTKKSLPPQFAVFYFKSKKSGKEQLHFVPLCAGCKKVIFDIDEANLSVVTGSPGGLRRVKGTGTQNDEFEIYREPGTGVLLCWSCDEKYGKLPWQYARATFRGLDEPMRGPKPFHVGASGESR